MRGSVKNRGGIDISEHIHGDGCCFDQNRQYNQNRGTVGFTLVVAFDESYAGEIEKVDENDALDDHKNDGYVLAGSRISSENIVAHEQESNE